MKKTIGGILAGGGLLGVIYYGYQYYTNSDTFEALGADIAISTGDYVPIIVAAAVMVIGVIVARSK